VSRNKLETFLEHILISDLILKIQVLVPRCLESHFYSVGLRRGLGVDQWRRRLHSSTQARHVEYSCDKN